MVWLIYTPPTSPGRDVYSGLLLLGDIETRRRRRNIWRRQRAAGDDAAGRFARTPQPGRALGRRHAAVSACRRRFLLSTRPDTPRAAHMRALTAR